MDRRWLLLVVAAAASVAAGCASGDGVPEAMVYNRFGDGCIVEASFLGYGFTSPIGDKGSMAPREVPEGSGKAYAIRQFPPAGGDCYSTVTEDGGELWITNKSLTATAGQRTDIVFSQADAELVPCSDARYSEGVKLFARLVDSYKNCP